MLIISHFWVFVYYNNIIQQKKTAQHIVELSYFLVSQIITDCSEALGFVFSRDVNARLEVISVPE